MRKLVITVILIYTVIFSLSPKAQSYYAAGVSAMSVGDCRAALEWFKEAILEDPTLEDAYPNVKLWMGVCAYEIGNYAMARDLLKLFPDNELARTIIDRIDKGLSPEEKEWLVIKDLIKKNVETLREVNPPATPSTPSTSTESREGKSPFLLFLGIFVIVFAALMIAEMKFALISSMIARIPKVRIVIGEAEVVREVVHETMAEEKEEEEKVEEKEIEVDLEELMNATLDTVDRLIYGDEFAEVEEEEEESEIEKVAEELTFGTSESEEREEKEEEKEGEEVQVSEEIEHEKITEEAERVEKEEVEEKELEEKKKEAEKAVEEREEEMEIKIETTSEGLTEEDIEELEKKFKEVISKEEEEEEEEIPLELAGKSPQEIMEELEEKEEYDEEDAEKLVYAIEKLLKGEEES